MATTTTVLTEKLPSLDLISRVKIARDISTLLRNFHNSNLVLDQLNDKDILLDQYNNVSFMSSQQKKSSEKAIQNIFSFGVVMKNSMFKELEYRATILDGLIEVMVHPRPESRPDITVVYNLLQDIASYVIKQQLDQSPKLPLKSNMNVSQLQYRIKRDSLPPIVQEDPTKEFYISYLPVDVYVILFSLFIWKEQSSLRLICKKWSEMLKSIMENYGKFVYHSDFDTNGILYWLGTDRHTKQYSVTHLSRMAAVRTSTGATSRKLENADNSQQWNHSIINLFNREPTRVFISGPDGKTYFEIDLGPVVSICPNYYTMRHSSSQDRAPRSWDLLASNDGNNWTVLSSHVKDTSINKRQHSSASFPINGCSEFYRYFRLLRTGPTAMNCSYWHVSGVEFYGEVFIIPSLFEYGRSE